MALLNLDEFLPGPLGQVRVEEWRPSNGGGEQALHAQAPEPGLSRPCATPCRPRFHLPRLASASESIAAGTAN